jgi:hypothetical protein
MILGKKLPLALAGTTAVAIGTVFVNHDIGNRYFHFREASPLGRRASHRSKYLRSGFAQKRRRKKEMA